MILLIGVSWSQILADLLNKVQNLSTCLYIFLGNTFSCYLHSLEKVPKADSDRHKEGK